MEAKLLITADQVKKMARREKLAVGILEKDYALTWLLKGFYQEDSGSKDFLVLKGGTAIRKAYFPETWRFSEDLDFTFIGEAAPEKIKDSTQRTLESLRVQSGINYSIESFHTTEGSIIGEIRFLGPLNFANRIRHDISLKEKLVLEPRRMPIKAKFSDLPEFTVLVYSLDEILAEKIRSIMQRGYSRDYYDVWRLLKENKFKDSEITNNLVKKCELKGIQYQPTLLFDENRLNEARAFWIKGLGYLTNELPKFDTVINELKTRLKFLEN